MKKLLQGAVVQTVGRHGKYFWIRFNDNTIMLMHFGMTGMIHLQNVKSHLVFMENGGDKKVLKETLERKSKYFTEPIKKEESVKNDEEDGEDEWPPRFSKMEIVFTKGADIQMSFADARRLGRVRILTDIKAEEDMFKLDPLNRQGPDYSKTGKQVKLFEFGDPDPFNYVCQYSQQEFNHLILLKRKPIKSLLLEQEYFAGVGNWVSDEILYQCLIHPQEVLSEKLTSTSPQLENLYNAIKQVCETSVAVEGNVKRFPPHWLMIYRWGKRRKKQEQPKVNGKSIDFVTVGGRTSCYVPAVQKKIKK